MCSDRCNDPLLNKKHPNTQVLRFVGRIRAQKGTHTHRRTHADDAGRTPFDELGRLRGPPGAEGVGKRPHCRPQGAAGISELPRAIPELLHEAKNSE